MIDQTGEPEPDVRESAGESEAAGRPKTGIHYIDNPFEFTVKADQKNHWSTAGLVLAVLFWPLGLVFSVIGLVKSRTRGDVGQNVALGGLALGLVFAVGTGLFLYAPRNKDYNDPGCLYAKPSLTGLNGQLTADSQQVLDASADVPGIIANINSLKVVFQQAAAKSTHQDAKDAFNNAVTGTTIYIRQLQGLEYHDQDEITQMEHVSTNLTFDVPALDRICGVSG